MTFKECLQLIEDLNESIEAKMHQITFQRELAEKITTTLSDMPKGSDIGNKTEKCVLRIWELQKSIDADIDALIEAKRDAEVHISKLPDRNMRDVLRYRYLDGMNFNEVAEKMYYHAAWVRKLHHQALDYLCG